MAIIPARFAAAYFNDADADYSAHGSAAQQYFPIVAGGTACQWPEGRLTCRLLEAGARLGLVDIALNLHKDVFGGQYPAALDDEMDRRIAAIGQRRLCAA